MAYFLKLINLHCTCPNNGDVDDLSISFNSVRFMPVAKMTYDQNHDFKSFPLIPLKKDVKLQLWTRELFKSKIELGEMKIPEQDDGNLTNIAVFGKKEQYKLNFEIKFEFGKIVLYLHKLESLDIKGSASWDKISLLLNNKTVLNNRGLKKGYFINLKNKYQISISNKIKMSLFRRKLMQKRLIGNNTIMPQYKSMGKNEVVFDNDGCLYEMKYEILQFVV